MEMFVLNYANVFMFFMFMFMFNVFMLMFLPQILSSSQFGLMAQNLLDKSISHTQVVFP